MRTREEQENPSRHRPAQEQMRQFFLKAPKDQSLPLPLTLTQKNIQLPSDSFTILFVDLANDFLLTNDRSHAHTPEPRVCVCSRNPQLYSQQ